MNIINNINYRATEFGLAGETVILAGANIVYNSPEDPQSFRENISVMAGLYIMALGVIASFVSNEIFNGLDRFQFCRSKES